MAKTRAEKEQVVADLAAQLEENPTLFVIAPQGMNPNEASELKIKLNELGGSFHLVKNSLFKLALEKAGFESNEALENGQNAVILAGDNTAEAAKIFKEFIKETNKAEFKDGYLNKQVISAEQVKVFADLPSREVLLAQVLATMNAPVTGFVNVLAGNVRQIVTVIDAIAKQKEETAS